MGSPGADAPVAPLARAAGVGGVPLGIRSECAARAGRDPTEIDPTEAYVLAANVQQYGGDTVDADEIGTASSPWATERAIRSSEGQG